MKKIQLYISLFIAVIFTQTVAAQTNWTGYWTFDNPSDLYEGLTGSTASIALYNDGKNPTASSTALSVVDGPVAGNKAVELPKALAFKLTTASAAALSSYTLVVDFKLSNTGTYTAFLSNDATNSDDGDIFRKNATLGFVSNYSGTISNIFDTWHRVVFVKNGSTSLDTYLDGTRIKNGTSSLSNSRYTTAAGLTWLFADDSGEDGDITLAGVAWYETALTQAEAEGLGSATTVFPTNVTRTITLTTSGDATASVSGLNAGANTVAYGDGVSFTVTPSSSSNVVIVTYNGDVLTPQSGTYAIPYIAANGTVDVKEIAPVYQTITVSNIAGFTISGDLTKGSNSVLQGVAPSFTITPDAGYTVLSVKYNDATLTPSGDVYTLPAVLTDGSLVVTLGVNAVITLDANGGVDMKTPTLSVTNSVPVNYPGASRRDGYLFGGWYENLADANPVLFPYCPAEPGAKTLYAKWISETDYANSANFTAYQSRVIRNSVFDKATKIKDIAMLGAHDAFTAQTSGSAVKAQELSGYQLAQRGVRLFDTRVMKDGSTWKTHHGTKVLIYIGEKNQDMAIDIQDVIRFADENPREVIILYLWPKESIDLGSTSNLTDFWNTLEGISYNGKHLSDFMNYSNTTPFKDLTYGDATADGTKAGIIIFALDDNASGASHNAYYLGTDVKANNYENNTSTDATKSNLSLTNVFTDKNRLRVAWAQRYNSGSLNLAGYVDAHNVAIANDSRMQTWLSQSPVICFDFVNHTDAFSSKINSEMHKYNIGEPNIAVSDVAITASTGVTVTQAKAVKTAQADVPLATDGSVTEIINGYDVTVDFTLSVGYHTPYVAVNGAKTAVSESGGTYTLTIPAVSESQTITLSAFAENVVPASEDTYIDGTSRSSAPDAHSTNYSASSELRIRKCGNIKNYNEQRAYVRFVIPGNIVSAYNKATLKIVASSILNGRTPAVRTV
ncbi:MAG: InlB B-repeat-containing protein, partial [Prevotella sp.]|nr:InlB B-repeat-containing protein [Prevotella sp.]